MLAIPEFDSLDMTCLKGVFCGSAPLPVAMLERYERRTGAIIVEGYGMSEATCTVAVNPLLSLRKTGSCGIVRPDTDLLVVDMETGTRPLPPGELGELIVRGPTVIEGYWNNPEETRKAIVDGWLYTGDIGYLDEDGYLFIRDRRHDVINTNGFKVYPREIEEIIYMLPEVAKVCVLGVPDFKRGEAVKAFICLKDEGHLSGEDILRWCEKHLVRYKLPAVIQFLDELPVTSVSKTDRNTLRRMEREKFDARTTRGCGRK
jgi:long-chain acyl-CoA synthetase